MPGSSFFFWLAPTPPTDAAAFPLDCELGWTAALSERTCGKLETKEHQTTDENYKNTLRKKTNARAWCG